MKQQLGKGKLETLVAQRLIDGEYPVELPFLLCFIKTKKKVTRFLNTMAYRLVQLFYHLQFDSDSLYYYNFFTCADVWLLCGVWLFQALSDPLTYKSD